MSDSALFLFGMRESSVDSLGPSDRESEISRIVLVVVMSVGKLKALKDRERARESKRGFVSQRLRRVKGKQRARQGARWAAPGALYRVPGIPAASAISHCQSAISVPWAR